MEQAASRSMTLEEAERRIAVLAGQVERHAAEAELARALVASSEDAIITADLRGAITGWNPGAERIYGYPAGEVVGQFLDVIVPDDRRQELGEQVASIARGERVLHFETVRRHRSGALLPVSLSLSPIRSPGGERIVGLAHIARDISERRRLDDELGRQRESLQRSNAALEEFAYAASHDLQEPLRMVASYTELLAVRYQGKLDEKADKYIRYAVDGARRMQRLVDDLLAYSRVGSQARPPAPVSADEVVRTVRRDLERAVADTGATVEHAALPTVMGDEVRLRQLFQNLIANALKFRGPEPPRIAIAAAPDPSGWLFSVRDNGIGIDPRYADNVFRMFQRLHARGTYEGNGIGLAIVRRIVEMHGGRIWFESRPGAGTTFFFNLPAAPEGSP